MMLEWISDHSNTISALSNVAMLFVWIAYLQLFLRSYRRQIRPKIVINRAAGTQLGAACFVSNMSAESIYLESVIVTLECGQLSLRHAVTDLDRLEGQEQSDDPRQQTLQGPLGSGDYTSIGTFESLVSKVLRRNGKPSDQLKQDDSPICLEIMIIADYSSDDLLIGAKRSFNAEWRNGEWCLSPQSAETHQIRSRRKRHDIRDLVAEHC